MQTETRSNPLLSTNAIQRSVVLLPTPLPPPPLPPQPQPPPGKDAFMFQSHIPNKGVCCRQKLRSTSNRSPLPLLLLQSLALALFPVLSEQIPFVSDLPVTASKPWQSKAASHFSTAPQPGLCPFHAPLPPPVQREGPVTSSPGGSSKGSSKGSSLEGFFPKLLMQL